MFGYLGGFAIRLCRLEFWWVLVLVFGFVWMEFRIVNFGFWFVVLVVVFLGFDENCGVWVM